MLEEKGIFKISYDEPEFNKEEVLKITGTDIMVNECFNELKGKLTYQVQGRVISIEEWLKLGFSDLDYLKDANILVVFGSTLGVEMDRILNKYSGISPAKALVFQAIGTERIESLLDKFQEEISKEAERGGLSIKNRISPGYGKFILENQKILFKILDLQKGIGLTLNESLSMSPSKSVTGVIPIGNYDCKINKKDKCSLCDKKDCEFRSV